MHCTKSVKEIFGFIPKKFRHICLEFPKGGLEGLFGTPTRNSRTHINLPHQHCSRVKTGRHCPKFCNKVGIIISTPQFMFLLQQKVGKLAISRKPKKGILDNKQWVNNQLLRRRKNTSSPTWLTNCHRYFWFSKTMNLSTLLSASLRFWARQQEVIERLSLMTSQFWLQTCLK